jgi:hypothetical protein
MIEVLKFFQPAQVIISFFPNSFYYYQKYQVKFYGIASQ